MSKNNRALTAAAVAAAGLMIAGGAAAANAATNGSAAPTASGYSAPGGQQGYGMPGQQGQQGQQQGGPRQMHQHTAVTGDELAKVKAAVSAKDSSITVSDVQKDPDGSYDVHGTKAGAQVMVEVSKDLKTVEVRTGGPGGHGGPGDHRGRGGSQDAVVTGDEAAKVKAAVTAKDSSVTVTEVRKDPDGSYDANGTKAGQQVAFDVSKDLATVTQRTMQGGPGGQQGGPQQGGPQQGGQAPTGAPTQAPTSQASA